MSDNVFTFDDGQPAESGVVLTLADAKAYLRIDHAADDALITSMIEAITTLFEQFTGLDLSSEVPAQVKQAMRIQLAAWYQDRAGEDAKSALLPQAVQALLWPLRTRVPL